MALGATMLLTACATPCATPPEQAALRSRAVQSDLVVAALNCDERDRYAAFVGRFEPQLAEQGRLLRAFFMRNYGEDGQAELDRYVTRLANEASTLSARAGGIFCARADRRLGELMQLDPSRFDAFVDRQPRPAKDDR